MTPKIGRYRVKLSDMVGRAVIYGHSLILHQCFLNICEPSPKKTVTSFMNGPFSQSSRSNSAVHWEKPQDNRTFSVERECHLQMTKILVICEKIALIAIGSTRRVGHVTCKESDWKSQLTIGTQ